jgi:L-aspartate oxidase
MTPGAPGAAGDAPHRRTPGRTGGARDAVRHVEVDVVVVGSGIAGLSYALKTAAGASVLLLTKKERAASNTNWARGGIAAVVGQDDDPALHVADTLEAGAGLCHPDVVRTVVEEGPARIADLVAWGTAFAREGRGFSLGREGGHSRRRIVHAGDRTGRAIEGALLDTAAHRGLSIVEDHRVVELVVEGLGKGGSTPAATTGRRVVGVRALPEHGGPPLEVRSRVVYLATGGCGRIYRHTTNPAIATGDGVAMAYRAGARIANMEFIQFHPTALHPTEDPAFLISEALRGEGAVLRRRDGAAFMDGYDPRGSLASRDVVARAIASELRATGDAHVVLDVSPLGERVMARRFPATLAGCRARGVDPLERGIPVVPAAHYACGGILTDLEARTSLPGLLAAGEVACTGLHGANRLASNSLLEAVVLAHRAAEHTRGILVEEGRWRSSPHAVEVPPADPEGGVGARVGGEDSGHTVEVERVRDLLWERAGIVRDVAGLEAAREELEVLVRTTEAAAGGCDAPPRLHEARNVALTGLLVVRSALARRESRGLHWLRDHPARDDARHAHDTILGGP